MSVDIRMKYFNTYPWNLLFCFDFPLDLSFQLIFIFKGIQGYAG